MHFEFYFEAFGFPLGTNPSQYRYNLDVPLPLLHGLSGRCCFGPRFAGRGRRLWMLPWPFGAVGAGPQGGRKADYSRATPPSC